MNERLFRTESANGRKSLEQTEEYLKVSHPNLCLVIAAIAILLGSFLMWGCFAKIPTLFSATGVVKNNEITIFLSLEEVQLINGEMNVLIEGTAHRIDEISKGTISREELKAQYGDLIDSQLKLMDRNFLVTADAQGVSDGVKEVSIVTDEEQPLTYLLHKKTPTNKNVQGDNGNE